MSITSIIKKKIKKILGIESLKLYYKKKRKAVLKNFYRKKYTSEDLVSLMKKMGMKQGSVVFIHSAMTEFYNFSGTGEEFIAGIIDAIGPDGTLLMPAYPKIKFAVSRDVNDPDSVDFDVNETPSAAGYLTEVFRRYPGVKRSINLQHSVCAYGKLADYFTCEHHLSETAWDERSPYYKLYLTDALVFCMGLSRFLKNATVYHCTESLLKNKYQYFALFFTKEFEYKYKDAASRTGFHKVFVHDPNFIQRKATPKKIIKRYFKPSEFHVGHISNLRIEMVNAKYMLDVLLEQAEKGNTMYSKPSPLPYKRGGRFLPI
jgi:aminoglycoside 3-N-acetyltransferase